MDSDVLRNIEITHFSNTLKGQTLVCRKGFSLRQVCASSQIYINAGNWFAVQSTDFFGSVIKADNRNVDICALQHPIPVRYGGEDVAGFLDAGQHRAVGLEADSLRRQQPSAAGLAALYLGAGLLEPVAAKVAGVGDAAAVVEIHCVDVFVAQLFAEGEMAEKRRVADDELGGGPFGFGGIVRVGKVEDGIGLADGVHGGQDGCLEVVDAVGLVPLDVTYPKSGAGQLDGIGIYLEASIWLGLTAGNISSQPLTSLKSMTRFSRSSRERRAV